MIDKLFDKSELETKTIQTTCTLAEYERLEVLRTKLAPRLNRNKFVHKILMAGVEELEANSRVRFPPGKE